MNPEFQYNHVTNTVKLMPGNYSVLVRNSNRWIVDMDSGIEISLAKRIFELFHTCILKDVMIGHEMAERFNILFV